MTRCINKGQQMPSVLVVEPRLAGHHGFYLSWMTQGLLQKGCAVTVVTSVTELEHPELDLLRARWGERLRITGMQSAAQVPSGNDSLALLRRELSFHRMFSRWFSELRADWKPDVVFVPYLDYCLYGVAILGSPFQDVPWVGVAMRPTFHLQRVGVIAPVRRLDGLKERLFRRLTRNRYVKGLFVTDANLAKYAERRFSGVPVTTLNEPITPMKMSKREAMKLLTLSTNVESKVVLVYGAISLRKGIEHLLSSLNEWLDCPRLTVILAGEVDSEAAEVLTREFVTNLVNEGTVIVRNKYHDRTEEAALFSVADIVWLGYKEHYTSSGVLAQAGAARIPVIACKVGVIGERVKSLGMGLTIEIQDRAEIRSALLLLTRDEQFARECGDRGHAHYSRFTLDAAMASVADVVADPVRVSPKRSERLAGEGGEIDI